MPKKVTITVPTSKSITWIATSAVVVLLVGVISYFVISNGTIGGISNNNKGKSNSINECPNNMICTPKNSIEMSPLPIPVKRERDPTYPTEVVKRDYRVLNDPLYPPLNRTDARTFSDVVDNTRARNFNVPTNDTGDTYRVVGYLVSQESKQDVGGNNWKLMARQKDRNTSDFYMVPANNNYDVKIPISDNMTVGTRLRDIYTIPNQVEFNSPMLNKGPYEFVENPKTDFTSVNYF